MNCLVIYFMIEISLFVWFDIYLGKIKPLLIFITKTGHSLLIAISTGNRDEEYKYFKMNRIFQLYD